jgi:hypothetical protein
MRNICGTSRQDSVNSCGHKWAVVGLVVAAMMGASPMSDARADYSEFPSLLGPLPVERKNPLEAVARAQRANVDAARRAVARAVDAAAKLQEANPAMVAARRSVLSSLNHFRAVRDVALRDLRQSSEYRQLVGRIYNAEISVLEVHRDPFTPVADELAAARKVLELRIELTRLEADILQGDPSYLEATDDLRLAAENLRTVQNQQRIAGWSDGALLGALSRLEAETQRLMLISP